MARSFKIYSSALHLVELQTRPLLQLSNQTVLIVGQDVPEWPPFVLMAAIISFLSLLMEELQRSCIHHLLQLYQPAKKKKRDQFYGIKNVHHWCSKNHSPMGGYILRKKKYNKPKLKNFKIFTNFLMTSFSLRTFFLILYFLKSEITSFVTSWSHSIRIHEVSLSWFFLYIIISYSTLP